MEEVEGEPDKQLVDQRNVFALNVVQRFHIQEVYHVSTLNAQNVEPICYPPLEIGLNLRFIHVRLFDKVFLKAVFKYRYSVKIRAKDKNYRLVIIIV